MFCQNMATCKILGGLQPQPPASYAYEQNILKAERCAGTWKVGGGGGGGQTAYYY